MTSHTQSKSCWIATTTLLKFRFLIENCLRCFCQLPYPSQMLRNVLVGRSQAITATIKCQIGHKASRSTFTEYPSLLSAGSTRGLENHVFDRSCLSRWPVKAVDLSVQGKCCEINDEITELSPENICGSISSGLLALFHGGKSRPRMIVSGVVDSFHL